METVLKGTKSVVRIAPDGPTILIGKRASPASRKQPVDGSAAGYVEIARNEVLAQVAAGADVVDLDLDVADSEQITLLPRLVDSVQQVVEVPLSINSTNPKVLAAALDIYQGKPLVNAVSGQLKSLKQMLPVAAEYGAAIIGTCMDEDGIPEDPEKRLEIASNIIERAEAVGICRKDILIDCQTSAVEIDAQAALVTLETVRLVRTELGVNITLNVSDIATELPNPVAIHQAFLAVVIAEGVNAPMANASQARQTILATDVLLRLDERMLKYIKYYHFRRSGMRSLVDWELVGY